MARKTTCRSSYAFTALLGLAVVVTPALGQEAPRTTTHTVRRGDTLWGIAREHFGDAARWTQLYQRNTGVIEDPHWIYPGEVLKLELNASGEVIITAADAATEPEGEAPEVIEPEAPVVTAQVRQDPGEFYEYPMPEFARRRPTQVSDALMSYVDQTYRPLRAGEFYSSGFLTEGQSLPFGKLLGVVTPQQIRNLSDRSSATLYSTVAVRAPAGGQYAPGDSLLVVQLGNEWRGHGASVIPTGLIRITERRDGQDLGEVVAVYGPIRDGQLVLPAERFSPGPDERAIPIEDGLRGEVIGGRELRELKHPLNVLFLDLGRADGVRPGDLFEVRRRPGARANAADMVDELMATGQIVRVGPSTSTLLLLQVVSPDIAPGTPTVQVARLPSGPDR